jgi:hypothetical protein
MGHTRCDPPTVGTVVNWLAQRLYESASLNGTNGTGAAVQTSNVPPAE